MTLWLDAQLPPALAGWIEDTFGIPTRAMRDLGLREAKDREIFEAAANADAVVMSKDADFVQLLERFGPPPQVLWVTCGNTTNSRLRDILGKCLPAAILLIKSGEPLVEIADSV